MAVLVIEDPALVEQIEQIAQEEQRAPVEVIADAVQRYAAGLQLPLADKSTNQASRQKKATHDFLRAITGLGASGHRDTSSRDEEILEADVDPIYGWGQRDDEPVG